GRSLGLTRSLVRRTAEIRPFRPYPQGMDRRSLATGSSRERAGLGMRVMSEGAEAMPVAAPFEALPEAVDVLLEQLMTQGLGHWSLQDGRLDLTVDDGNTLPIVLPDGSLMGLLRAGQQDGVASLSTAELESVHQVARLLATLLDAERRADRSHRRAMEAEVESMTDALTG